MPLVLPRTGGAAARTCHTPGRGGIPRPARQLQLLPSLCAQRLTVAQWPEPARVPCHAWDACSVFVSGYDDGAHGESVHPATIGQQRTPRFVAAARYGALSSIEQACTRAPVHLPLPLCGERADGKMTRAAVYGHRPQVGWGNPRAFAAAVHRAHALCTLMTRVVVMQVCRRRLVVAVGTC
ncbi:hypothetical protein EON67_01300 [archaeon]|nr:MAG: hypothetical protein EON67_01300 [archaeon]